MVEAAAASGSDSVLMTGVEDEVTLSPPEFTRT